MLEDRNVRKDSQFSEVLRYQQQWRYESAQKNNRKESEFQENLLQALNRIETKLDILLMQRGK
ncbi:hypothetical protein ACFOU2_15305 [Bacillus songklensis]|uniref:Uncharacterized protein n=1 Tax=Bacillus songklensis TaxID=1069116 RepID=A0ABV8B3E1_9BACI